MEFGPCVIPGFAEVIIIADINQIQTIIEAQTSYSGNYFPLVSTIDEVEGALPKFVIDEPSGFFNTSYNRSSSFIVLIEATDQDELETAIQDFIEMSTDHPDGYKFATVGYPLWIEVQRGPSLKANDNDFQAIMKIEARWSLT